MKANAQGTNTVAPKATYFLCSQAGQRSRVSVPAPESQKNMRLMVFVIKYIILLGDKSPFSVNDNI